ncbi:MAG TPA: hypothetical protein DFR83_20605 [Deltaproteobacteria bacterium]|nr:hypothetical protein [Deltaproteobacteria bacterium]
MSVSIDSSAGTRSIQSIALQSQIDSPSGRAPTSPPTSAHSRAQTSVDQLFQLTAGLASQLTGRLEQAAANRIQGGEGLDPGGVVQSLTEIKEKVDELTSRAPTLTQFTDALTAELTQAIESGRGGSDQLLEMVQQAQKALADKYGYVGHIINISA